MQISTYILAGLKNAKKSAPFWYQLPVISQNGVFYMALQKETVRRIVDQNSFKKLLPE